MQCRLLIHPCWCAIGSLVANKLAATTFVIVVHVNTTLQRSYTSTRVFKRQYVTLILSLAMGFFYQNVRLQIITTTIKRNHKQCKITHAIICDLVWLAFMSNIKAILKFYVRQMWQGMQQATTNYYLPTTERKKDWSKKDWLLLKRKRKFLFVGKATACKHAYLTRSIRSQNKLPIWKQFGQTTHLVERTPHQYLYFIALGKYYCESRSKLFPGRHKSVLLWKYH